MYRLCLAVSLLMMLSGVVAGLTGMELPKRQDWKDQHHTGLIYFLLAVSIKKKDDLLFL